MKTLDQIFQNRYSVRSYADKSISQQDIIRLIEAARLAPSACNSQTWRFITVTDKITIAEITDKAMRPVVPNRWLKKAPLLIVGCSQLDITANKIGSKITGIAYYQIDIGIAMEHMVLKATDIGLGTCWIGWFREKMIKEILGIPNKIKVVALLSVGYPNIENIPIKKRKPLEKILFCEKWGRTISANDDS